MKHAAESPRRITGTEMEWGGMVPGELENKLRQTCDLEVEGAVNNYLDKQDIARVGSIKNYFLGNGARFYRDVYERREYATPEDDSFIGTCANEIVNDNIMAGIAEEYTSILTEDLLKEGRTPEEIKKINRNISFTKRVIDDNYVGCGYHISYSADAKRMSIDEHDLSLFGVFAATRATLFGTGALLPFGEYAIAQKAVTVDADYDLGTVSTKPVINLRKEPLADSSRFLRIHDTSADPNMSPWATRVKLGAGSIVLCMIESGMRIPKLRFEDDLHHVTTAVAFDTSLKKRYKLVGEGSMTALDVQQALVEQGKILDKSGLLSEEEQWTLDEWEHAIYDLRKDPRKTIDRLDWTMRLAVLERLHNKHGWAWNSEELRYKDRQFSDVALDGIAVALRENIWAKFMPPADMISKRLRNPPETTRALIRGRMIQHLYANAPDTKVSIDWSHVYINDDRYMLSDPFNPRHAGLEEGLAS